MIVQIHTDSPFFSGSENMVAMVSSYFHLNTDNKDKLYISYRKSIKYDKGLREKINEEQVLSGLKLIDINDLLLKDNVIFIKKIIVLLSIIFEPIQFLINFSVLLNNYKNKKIDVLHINNGGFPGADSCNAAVLAAKICKIKYITYTVNNIIVPYRGKRAIGRLMDKLLIRFVDIFITASEFAGQQLIETLKIDSRNYTQLYNGITKKEVKIGRNAFLKTRGLPESKIIFGIVAIHEERKGHIFLLKAFNILKNKGIELPLLLIEGEGPLTPMLKEYVVANKLQNNIYFIGNVDNIFDFYNCIDCFILSSIRNEDFPNVIIESMSMGKGIIGTRIAGIPEQIEKENGIVVNPSDEYELAEAIESVINNKHLLNEWGIESRKIFNRKYKASIAVKRYVELWRSGYND